MSASRALGPIPNITLTTPSGYPASFNNLHSTQAVTDVISDGLQITVFPVNKTFYITHFKFFEE
jgi:hypothetical protein